jgi:carbonic anhydrase
VLQLGEASFELEQYHFHAPSEHTVDGRRFPMEMHLVHQAADGEFAVLGVLIDEGAHNAAFDPVFSRLPRRLGERVHLEHVQVDIDDLLPSARHVYRYRGSLTTPPCSEGVRWFVGAQPVELSAGQIETFTSIIHGNNRPLQSRGSREVTLDAGR